MAEFHQARLGQSKVDIEHLNFILRQIWSTISNLDGSEQAVKYKGNIDMGGKSIAGGPASQKTAKDGDFITKSYFASDEFAEIIRQIVERQAREV